MSSSRVGVRAGAGRLLLAALPRGAGAARPARATPATPAVLRLPPDAGGHSAQRALLALPLRLPLAPHSARGPSPVRSVAQVAPQGPALLLAVVEALQRRPGPGQEPPQTRQSPASSHE